MTSERRTMYELLVEKRVHHARLDWMAEVGRKGLAPNIMAYENGSQKIDGIPVYILNADPIKQKFGTVPMPRDMQIGKQLLDKKEVRLAEVRAAAMKEFGLI